ncbi:MAG: fibronectin type III-like domain-contianing protein, partial [Asticcacaulis sp.]|nr:fibronectin type III-like domain-contianing protein [Asticcacaulis sp.]
TWPASEAQLPPMMDYDIRHGRTYMYAKGRPLYPFGYGLSYTTFRYGKLRTSAPVLVKDGEITVEVEVTNTGKVAGDTVVQLYVQHPRSKVARPERELKGFQRIHLAAGETRTVGIPLKASRLAWWNDAASGFEVEQEPIRLLVGESSADIRLTRMIEVK